MSNPNYRPGNHINELILNPETVIHFLVTHDDNFIVLTRDGEHRTINQYELARTFGILFVGYQCEDDQLQVYVADHDGTSLYVRGGEIEDIERIFETTLRVSTLLMSLRHRIVGYPANFIYNRYELIDENGVHVPFEVTNEGNVVSENGDHTIEEFIHQFE